jgi:hypothetical protein
MKNGMIGVMVGFIVLGTVVSVAVHYNTQDTVTATITDKDRIVERDGDGGTRSKYLIFTDQETFENTDSLLAGKFNSSDVYGRLKVGDVCRFKVNGFRNGFLSMYRNILEATCETPEA